MIWTQREQYLIPVYYLPLCLDHLLSCYWLIHILHNSLVLLFKFYQRPKSNCCQMLVRQDCMPSSVLISVHIYDYWNQFWLIIDTLPVDADYECISKSADNWDEDGSHFMRVRWGNTKVFILVREKIGARVVGSSWSEQKKIDMRYMQCRMEPMHFSSEMKYCWMETWEAAWQSRFYVCVYGFNCRTGQVQWQYW